MEFKDRRAVKIVKIEPQYTETKVSLAQEVIFKHLSLNHASLEVVR